MLKPVRRIQLPPEIVRRLNSERHPNLSEVCPIEPDGDRIEAATGLINALNNNLWASANIFGETIHVLDEISAAHSPFIRTEFPPESFIPWQERRVHIHNTDSGPLYSNNEIDSPSFYHYWQIFWLAAILRSGIHIYYPLDDEDLTTQLFHNSSTAEVLEGRSYQTINFEAYQELRELREYEQFFDAVGYFWAYTNNALQVHRHHCDENGRIQNQYWRQYLRREREIAQYTLSHSGLNEADFIEFIGKQCEWWDNARRVGPEFVAEEYKRNINASIGLLRAGTEIDPRQIIETVGRRTGHFKPALDVIFPDWTEEQRDLTIRSIKRWADDELARLPAPFPVTETELNSFCDWLEERGLFQYYWHFRRLLDLQRRDDPVHHAASTSEVVGFATLCEMIANEVMIDRGLNPRGSALFRKLREIFNAHGPVNLGPFFGRFGNLANTKSQSLSQRLAQIARIRRGGAHSSILRIMLSLMVIRNEGAHLGLLRFDHFKVIDMIRILSLASLILWKAR